MEIDAIRQTQATLVLEQLPLDQNGIDSLKPLVAGEISLEDHQNKIKELFQSI